MARHDGLLLVTCPECDGSAVTTRCVWVYERGCGFPHRDTEEDPCPGCEGAGQILVEGELVTLRDLEEMETA